MTTKPTNSPTTHPLPAQLVEFLKTEISALELANLLDGHLHSMVDWIGQSGQPWNEEEVSTYHHLRRLRDLFVEISNAKPVKP